MSENIIKTSQRFDSVDLLRGLVMVIMLLDHTREYVHAEAFHSTPTDLTKTNVRALFYTLDYTSVRPDVCLSRRNEHLFPEDARQKSGGTFKISP